MSKAAEPKWTGDLTSQQATIYHELKTALNKYSKAPSELEENELSNVRQLAQKQFEIEQLVLASDEANDVIIPEPYVEKSLADIRARYENEDEFHLDLEKNKLTVNILEKSLYRELKVEAVLARVGSKVAAISDIDIKLYYFLHKDKFTQPESRVTYHILITINDDSPENKREQSLKKINDIKKRVLNKPKRFQEQAGKHSECPTALNKGYIGNIPRGQLFPELEEVLFSLNEGAISDVVESEMGYHLIYCEKIYADGPVEYKRAAEVIKEKLLTKRQRICQKSWLNSLAKASD